MRFQWDTDPETLFADRIDGWQREFKRVMTQITRVEAQRATAFLQQNAPWQDRTYKARAGLRAEMFMGDDAFGITAMYNPNTINPKTGEAYSFDLEQRLFKRAGVLSIILDRRSPSFLGEYADYFMDVVKEFV